MKWLLVTTNRAPHIAGTNHPHGAGWNVGDQFARLGVEELVYEVDRNAEVELVNMDSEISIVAERAFDRAIFAGRPMFWDRCETHPLWTHLLRGWLCREPRKVLALGVGDCYPLDRSARFGVKSHPADRHCWRVIGRSNAFDSMIPCPSTWV